MPSQEPTFIHDIPLSRLDPTDRTFAVGPHWLSAEALRESIARVGICCPLRIEILAPDRFRIVSGFKRYRIASELGFNSIPCLVVEAGDTFLQYVESIWENLGSRELQEVERAEVITSLHNRFGVSTERLVREFLSPMGVKADRLSVDRYLRLNRLPDSVQKRVPWLSLDIALDLGRWTEADQALYLLIAETYRLGKNKQRQMLELLDEIRDILRLESPSRGLCDYWIESGAQAIWSDQTLERPEQYRRLNSLFRETRYPVLTENEKRATELKKTLRIPPGTQFSLPEFFEGNQIGIRFQVRDSLELRKVSQRLLEISSSQALDELFDLL